MQTHSFSVEAAIRYGLTEAIMLQLLSSWLDERSQDEDYFCWEGRPWLKLTMRQFQSELPYLSPFKLQTSLELLQSCKLIDIYDEKMLHMSQAEFFAPYDEAQGYNQADSLV